MPLPLPIPEFKPAEPVPFFEAINWFRQQAPWISGSSWNTMASLAALKGDQISSTTLLAVLDDVWSQMDRAVAEGKPYGEFVRDVADVLDTRWYKADSARLKLIYHNNVGGALMAGREARMQDVDILEARPFVLFDGIGDWRQTLEICKPRDGVVLPADDPWWKLNSPMLHHGCRSGKVTLDEEDAKEMGGVTNARKLEGLEPAQKGWGKPASWTDWKPDPANYHAPLMEEYTRWTQGKEYISEKQEWDAKWQRYAETLLGKKAKVETIAPPPPEVIIPVAAPRPMAPITPKRAQLVLPVISLTSKVIVVASDKGHAAALKNALARIDAVHGITRMDETYAGTGDGYLNGKYDPKNNRVSLVATGRKAADYEATAIHEFGHMLDYRALGRKNEYGEDDYSSKDPVAGTAIFNLMETIRGSEGVKKLVALATQETMTVAGETHEVDREYVSYLLKHQELFARAYYQYIVTVNPSPALKKGLAESLKEVYQDQWDAKDFKLIKEAFDELLKEEGWLKEK